MKPENGRRIFKIVFLLFLVVVVLVLIDMARQTTAPWKKQIERVTE